MQHAMASIPLDPSSDKDVGTWLLQHGGSTDSALEQPRQQGPMIAAAVPRGSMQEDGGMVAPSSTSLPMGLPEQHQGSNHLDVLFERLRGRLGLKRDDAAKNLHLAPRTFKNVCRRFGIMRWPQARRIAMLREALKEALAQSVVAGNPGSSGGDNASADTSPQQQEQQQQHRHDRQQEQVEVLARPPRDREQVARNAPQQQGGAVMPYTTRTGRRVKHVAPVDV